MKWMRSLLQSLFALVMLVTTAAQAAPQGDYVLGAGDITQWAYALPGQLEGLG